MEEIVFPNQIRMFRRVKGISMKRLAGRLGMSLSAISKIEKGYRRVNEQQLTQIAAFLECPESAILITEHSSQPEVIKAWEQEQERRIKINQGNGLKTMGAGLRYLRGRKSLTLLEIASRAHMTLSVYHRIEMGQREVDEKTFARIAHALGYSVEDLQLEIYNLDMAGALEDLKSSEEKKNGLYVSKGGYNDLPLGRFMRRSNVDDVIVPILGLVRPDGSITINRSEPISSLVAPSTLAFDKDIYAVSLMTPTLGDLLPKRSLIVISPASHPEEGDLIAFPEAEDKIWLMKLMRDDSGNYYGQMQGRENMPLTKNQALSAHKIVAVMLA